VSDAERPLNTGEQLSSWRSRQLHKPSAGSSPYISVVIPSRNNPAVLKRCLRHLLDAEGPPCEWEVIIVDNSDAPALRENYQLVIDSRDPRLRRVVIPALGLMAARHVGARRARGRVLAFIDDDVLVGTEWLTGLHASFAQGRQTLVIGPVRPRFHSDPPAWTEPMWVDSEEGRCLPYLSLLDLGDVDRPVPPQYAWGCNMALPRELFFCLGGTHPDYLPEPWKDFQGDGEVGLANKVGALGFSAFYTPACGVEHLVPDSRLSSVYLQARAYFAGLHASYTQVRSASGLDAWSGTLADTGHHAFGSSHIKTTMRYWHDSIALRVREARSRYFVSPSVGSPDLSLLGDAWRAGWRRHQKRVRTDPQLLRWVLLPDYMGWELSLPGLGHPTCLFGLETGQGTTP
jgi:glucosyl-dolichyl phosphate glucuronosyltransferase